TERKQAEEKEKEHHKNIQLLSNTAMKFVEFPADKNIYNFIGEQLRELIGKDSYIVINAIDEEKSILTTRTVLGLGKLSDKVAGLLGKHPVGMTFNAKDEELVYHLSDGKLHLNEEGLYGMLLKTVPKTVCNSIEKLLNIKKIYGIGFTKDNELFGTVIIFLKENAGELKNKQIIEAFSKQASIAVQKRRAEEALRDSQHMLQTVLDSTPAGIFWKDRDSIYLGGNRTWLETVGLKSSEEVVGKSDYDLTWEKKQADSFREDDRRVMESGIPGYDIIEPYLQADGTHAWAKTNKVPLRDTEGNVVGVLSTYEDITERKQAEEALRESEEKYRSLVESTEDSIYLLDRNCTYLFMNKKHLTRLSLAPKKAIGRIYAEFHSEDDTKDFIGKAEKVFKTGRSLSYEYRSERDGGYYIRTLSPVKETDGSSKAIIVVSKDITEHKQSEETLRESEEKFRSLFENMLNGIAYCKILLDENNHPIDFVYLEVNDSFEKLTGLKKENVVGKKVTEAIPGIKDAHPELFDIYGKVALTGEETVFEIYFEPLEIWLSISVYSPQKGYFVAIIENIADRKLAEEELLKSRSQLRDLSTYLQSAREQERTSIAREIHDDLGQILTALKMDLSWMGKRFPKNQKPLIEKKRSMLKILDAAIKTVKRIITDLRPGLLDDLGLIPAIEWQAEDFQNRSGIACKLTVDPEDIVMDEERSTAVFRIFQETLTNAARHAKATEIVASLKEEEGTIELIVRDNGKGITEKQISDPKSFGLMGIRERAISCGGEVKIKGVLGEGTTVTVRIPMEEISRKDAKNAK
ncbi:MAG: PAS domain S-box protein, partial [Desulfobacteraceae bacterium]|nr:PAS domain S-box protein [Desulfobacteraceae bacterium]